MSLSLLIASLELDLSRDLPRNTASFAEARARRPEIAPFLTIGALTAALTRPASLPVSARRALIAALVTEAQEPKGSFASAALVLAFAPMLHRLRNRTGGRNANPDLDSTILLAFTSAVRVVPPGPYSSLGLRWATERTVLRVCRAERRHRRTSPFDETLHSQSPFHMDGVRERVNSVLHSLAKDGAAEILEVLIATRGTSESLREYVARICPRAADRRARYQELYRARRRFEREVRQQFKRRAA